MKKKGNIIYVPSSRGVVAATCVVWENYGSIKYAPHTQLLSNSSPTIPEGMWLFFKTTYNTDNSLFCKELIPSTKKGTKSKNRKVTNFLN